MLGLMKGINEELNEMRKTLTLPAFEGNLI